MLAEEASSSVLTLTAQCEAAEASANRAEAARRATEEAQATAVAAAFASGRAAAPVEPPESAHDRASYADLARVPCTSNETVVSCEPVNPKTLSRSRPSVLWHGLNLRVPDATAKVPADCMIGIPACLF